MQELYGLLPTTNPKAANAAPIPELSLLHLLPPHLSIAKVNSLKTTYILIPQTHCIKESRQLPGDGLVVFST